VSGLYPTSKGVSLAPPKSIKPSYEKPEKTIQKAEPVLH
jgi:hypothetical protein